MHCYVVSYSLVLNLLIVLLNTNTPRNNITQHAQRFPLFLLVSLQFNNAHFCGGTLIAKDVVLTAAHCLGYASFQAVIGRHDLTNKSIGDQVDVARIVVHPEWDNVSFENDFALLVLARTATASDAQLAKLNNNEGYPASGTTAHVMGWGDLEEDTDKYKSSNVLMMVDTQVLTNQECREADGKLDGFNGSYEDFIFPDMICTLSKKQNACKGDSGGPLVVRGSSASMDVEIGIVSWSMPFGCATKTFPVVYSRVSNAYDWIKQNTCKHSAVPPGSLCGTSNPTGR
jgi:secreted trypsin-like serine protease